jgi:hypothetical protein
MRNVMTADRLGCRSGECEIVLLGTRRDRAGRHQPEQGVDTSHALVQDGRVVVGTHDDLHPGADTGVEARRIADDDADGVFAREPASEDLTAET